MARLFAAAREVATPIEVWADIVLNDDKQQKRNLPNSGSAGFIRGTGLVPDCRRHAIE
jgi:nitrate reductase alpha subunit